MIDISCQGLLFSRSIEWMSRNSSADQSFDGILKSLTSSSFLVGGLEHFLFSHTSGIIIPLTNFSEDLKPPTRFVMWKSLQDCQCFFLGSLREDRNM